jgi:hypothetical protein
MPEAFSLFHSSYHDFGVVHGLQDVQSHLFHRIIRISRANGLENPDVGLDRLPVAARDIHRFEISFPNRITD